LTRGVTNADHCGLGARLKAKLFADDQQSVAQTLTKPQRLVAKIQHLGARAPIHNALLCRHSPKKHGRFHSAAVLAHRISLHAPAVGGTHLKQTTDTAPISCLKKRKCALRGLSAHRDYQAKVLQTV
jgi:hypothetical protein